MAKKSYTLRNRRGYMDSTFDEGLRILLQWMERRRQDIELLLQKEMYMLRRMFWPRHTFCPGLLPGGPDCLGPDPPVREEMDWLRNRMGTPFPNHGLPYYAPGY